MEVTIHIEGIWCLLLVCGVLSAIAAGIFAAANGLDPFRVDQSPE